MKKHAENMHQKLIPDPFLILVNNPKQQRILLQIGYFEKGLSKRFKKVNFIFLSNRVSSVCHSHVLVCHAYVTRMYSYVVRMSLVCTRMSSVCTRMSCVCHSYVLVCRPYVTRMHSYVIRMYSYVIRMPLVCPSYVTCM